MDKFFHKYYIYDLIFQQYDQYRSCWLPYLHNLVTPSLTLSCILLTGGGMFFTLGGADSPPTPLELLPLLHLDILSFPFLFQVISVFPSRVANFKRSFRARSPASSDTEPGFSGVVNADTISSAACVRESSIFTE